MHVAIAEVLRRLDIATEPQSVCADGRWRTGTGVTATKRSPIDGSVLASLRLAGPQDVADVVESAAGAFAIWRAQPAPRRGEFVRRFGGLLRAHKDDLAALVSWEAGKITQEARGEVQEMIDICDFAVGLSRQLYGLTLASERHRHRLSELWHPLGPVGVITSFNFPMAVWSWNTMIALVCGDTVVWKPSEKTPLCAVACQTLLQRAAVEFADAPPGVSNLLVGGGDVGEAVASAPQLPLVSATGSVRMGRQVAATLAARLARPLLELGGNNAAIVTPSADLELALRAIVFAAVGTAGQRCTTLRRLIVHESVAEQLIARLEQVYATLPVGHPLDAGVLVGPLIDAAALDAMQRALDLSVAAGGRRHGGGRLEADVPAGGVYVRPALVEMDAQAQIVHEETFAPILYVMRYRRFEEAIALHNDVPQGLSSAIFTADLREAELFCSALGSDCGIVNVNLGTSGAEIGGAFGGEKATGGGRESGSDAWKAYMRRATVTVNFSSELPLAQGIEFDIN